MAKRSQKRLVHHERSQSGCMSGLIGIFDFRQAHSARKLLSDRRHSSCRHSAAGTGSARSRPKVFKNSDENHQGSDVDVDGFSDGGETEILSVGSKPSVKKLIEEDMSGEDQTKRVEHIRSDPDHKGNMGKNRKQIKKTCKVSRDIHVEDSKAAATLLSQEYHQPNSEKQLSHLDITSLMEEFCSQIQHRQELHMHNECREKVSGVQECTEPVKDNHLDELDMHLVQKHSVLQEKLREAAEAFLNQKLSDANQLTDNGVIQQSKQFIDALEILNSNKELLLKLLQDSNSLLVKHIQDLQDDPSDKVKQEKILGAKLSEGMNISRQAEELVCQKEVQKHNIHNLFRKKDKAQKKNLLKDSDKPQVSSRIVVLKPKATDIQNLVTANSPSSSPHSDYNLRNKGWSGRFNSQFSFSEIKKRLKYSLGENRKARHWISRDGILHKIPNKHQDLGNNGKVDPENICGKELPSKSHVHTERPTEPSNCGESEEKKGKPTQSNPSTAHEVSSSSAADCENSTKKIVGYPRQRKSNIYVEAKKHLEKILTGDKDGGFPYQQTPKSLGRILSLPEYTSPLCSPGRDGEHGFVTAQMRFSPNGNYRIISENIWRFKQDNKGSHQSQSRKSLEIQQDIADGVPDIKLQDPHSSEKAYPDTEIQGSICDSEEDSCSKGEAEIMDETNGSSLEKDHVSDYNTESSSSAPIISTGPTEVRDGAESPNSLALESSQQDRPPSSSLCSLSSSSLLIKKVESLENINDPPERPSPISVLEPCFEDINSPTTNTPRSDELQIQPLNFHIEEHDCSTVVVSTSDLYNYPRPCMDDKNPPFEYVTAVLQASNVDWDEYFWKYHSSELLLSPSLFDEVEVMFSQHCGDRELLFDCINKVLVELYERYFGSSPWVAFVSPNIRPAPMGKGIIPEVWDDINWNLLAQHTPRTLDEIIGKDMEKARAWMDFRFDTEVIGNEMVDFILEELMEDTISDGLVLLRLDYCMVQPSPCNLIEEQRQHSSHDTPQSEMKNF
ncbi:putative GPI-anchored adhesin-like protein [Thalictrum thalictroides]|uniref:Putative GPI-anchored adhesin-like protein n=1 Tax=Thalictrum thalictroides TaxID=46969 RepID=A0A7J6XCK3_THATH|nr:putative GPI-anchored adhesin-like protein [Thalictrum thalictroides]